MIQRTVIVLGRWQCVSIPGPGPFGRGREACVDRRSDAAPYLVLPQRLPSGTRRPTEPASPMAPCRADRRRRGAASAADAGPVGTCSAAGRSGPANAADTPPRSGRRGRARPPRRSGGRGAALGDTGRFADDGFGSARRGDCRGQCGKHDEGCQSHDGLRFEGTSGRMLHRPYSPSSQRRTDPRARYLSSAAIVWRTAVGESRSRPE
jgi:hypothetical protein